MVHNYITSALTDAHGTSPTAMKPTPIHLESQLLQAAREGITCYQPVFGDLRLEVDDGKADVSAGNLILLCEAGYKVVVVRVLDDAYRVLVLFETGESYLALGFGSNEGLSYFAEFLNTAVVGDASEADKNSDEALMAEDARVDAWSHMLNRDYNRGYIGCIALTAPFTGTPGLRLRDEG